MYLSQLIGTARLIMDRYGDLPITLPNGYPVNSIGVDIKQVPNSNVPAITNMSSSAVINGNLPLGYHGNLQSGVVCGGTNI